MSKAIKILLIIFLIPLLIWLIVLNFKQSIYLGDLTVFLVGMWFTLNYLEYRKLNRDTK